MTNRILKPSTLGILAVLGMSLAGCVYYPSSYGYGYGQPAYVAAPPVVVVGGGWWGGGWGHGGGWRR